MKSGQTSEKALRKALRKQGGWILEKDPRGRGLRVSREDSAKRSFLLRVPNNGDILLREINHMVRVHLERPDLLKDLPWFRQKHQQGGSASPIENDEEHPSPRQGDREGRGT